MAIERRHHVEVPAVIEQRKDLNPDYVKLVVRQGMSFMPSFRKTEISDADLSLLAAYVTHSQDLGLVKSVPTQGQLPKDSRK